MYLRSESDQRELINLKMIYQNGFKISNGIKGAIIIWGKKWAVWRLNVSKDPRCCTKRTMGTQG